METTKGPLSGRVAFVTGGGSGIGQAAALKLAQDGAKVAIFDVHEEDCKKVAAEISAQVGDGATLPLYGDVSHEGDVQKAYDTVAAKWGRLDIVFANAGINGVWSPLDELTLDEWNRTLSINLTGTFLTVKYALPHLKKQGGSVVITASVNGTRIFSNTGATAYSSTKAAQVAFAKMTALELAKDKIRVNVVCPGAVETNIEKSTNKRDLDTVKVPVEFPEGAIPLTHGVPARAAQVANLVAFLVSDAADHITGTEMWIDGGESLLMG